MSVTTKQNGYLPIAAVVGLVLALAAPIALVATHMPAVDKAAKIDTVSDPIAEIAWHVPIGNKLTVGQRMPSTSPLGSLAAPVK
jgi:hypothetical protein